MAPWFSKSTAAKSTASQHAEYKNRRHSPDRPQTKPLPKATTVQKFYIEKSAIWYWLDAIVNLINPIVSKLSHVKLFYSYSRAAWIHRLRAHLAATILMAPSFGFLDHFGGAMCSCKIVNCQIECSFWIGSCNTLFLPRKMDGATAEKCPFRLFERKIAFCLHKFKFDERQMTFEATARLGLACIHIYE